MTCHSCSICSPCGEVFASHFVQCAISSLNSVVAKPKLRSQEDNVTALAVVGPAAPFDLDAISTTSSPVISRPKTLGHSSYFQMIYKKGHEGLVVISNIAWWHHAIIFSKNKIKSENTHVIYSIPF